MPDEAVLWTTRHVPIRVIERIVKGTVTSPEANLAYRHFLGCDYCYNIRMNLEMESRKPDNAKT